MIFVMATPPVWSPRKEETLLSSTRSPVCVKMALWAMDSPVTIPKSAVTLPAAVRVITGQQKRGAWTLTSAPSLNLPARTLRFAKTPRDPLNALSLLPAPDQHPLPNLSSLTAVTLFVPWEWTASLGATG